MTLNELLPAIYSLNSTDKQKLFELLDHELHPTPYIPESKLQPENFENEGEWLIAVFERYFNQMESNEIFIELRGPIRVNETLFGES